MNINEAVSRICRSCGDRTDIGKANLWFVLKCRLCQAVILRPFRLGSEPQPSQAIIYVHFDRANAIEPLLVNVKCTYHVNSSQLVPRVKRRAPSSLLVQSRRYVCASCLPLASRSTNQPWRYKPPGCFILSQFVCIGPVLSSRWLFRRLRMLNLSRSPLALVWLY